jgi:hypothetical protein
MHAGSSYLELALGRRPGIVHIKVHQFMHAHNAQQYSFVNMRRGCTGMKRRIPKDI